MLYIIHVNESILNSGQFNIPMTEPVFLQGLAFQSQPNSRLAGKIRLQPISPRNLSKITGQLTGNTSEYQWRLFVTIHNHLRNQSNGASDAHDIGRCFDPQLTSRDEWKVVGAVT